jgi:hypothetical protein
LTVEEERDQQWLNTPSLLCSSPMVAESVIQSNGKNFKEAEKERGASERMDK